MQGKREAKTDFKDKAYKVFTVTIGLISIGLSVMQIDRSIKNINKTLEN